MHAKPSHDSGLVSMETVYDESESSRIDDLLSDDKEEKKEEEQEETEEERRQQRLEEIAEELSERRQRLEQRRGRRRGPSSPTKRGRTANAREQSPSLSPSVRGSSPVNNGNVNEFNPQQQQLLQLQHQMVAHQAQTLQALQDLSHTLTTLHMAQIKQSKEDDTTLNVDRATVRLDGLEVYAVVSALTVATAIACFDVYGSDDFAHVFISIAQIHRHNILSLILNTIFLAVSGVGIIAGLHATLVFSLMTMYGRTAVGVSHDEAFVEFFVQTGRVRYRGFHTFRLSLYCFLVQVLFTITSKCSPLLRPIIILINLVSMWWVYKDTQSVIDKAGDILFNFKGPNQQRRMSQGGSLSLQRTLSDVSLLGNRKRGQEESSEGGLQTMRNQIKSKSQREELSINGRYSRKKGVARSKSGTVVYDVGPQESRPVRRGRRPSKES